MNLLELLGRFMAPEFEYSHDGQRWRDLSPRELHALLEYLASMPFTRQRLPQWLADLSVDRTIHLFPGGDLEVFLRARRDQ